MGLYPVVADSASGFMGQDWRGNIAFNGYSLRAEGLQGPGTPRSMTNVQTTPVADPRNWGFAYYVAPTTFNVAVGEYGLQSVFDKDHADKNKQSMAHELGHYYFGTLLREEGVVGSVIAEGFAEFLSYELTRSVEGENVYRGLLRRKVDALANLRGYQPQAFVQTEADYGNRDDGEDQDNLFYLQRCVKNGQGHIRG